MYDNIFKLHSDLLKAMAHPKRLEIIHLLRETEISVSDIQTMLNMPQAYLSQHLQVLRHYHVVASRRQGKTIYYRLTHKNFIASCDLLRQFLVDTTPQDPLMKHLHHRLSDLLPTATDPVCGMTLTPSTASFFHMHDGSIYYFCASGCHKRFAKEPEKFLPCRLPADRQVLPNNHQLHSSRV